VEFIGLPFQCHEGGGQISTTSQRTAKLSMQF
jgi:hypothetical protein